MFLSLHSPHLRREEESETHPTFASHGRDVQLEAVDRDRGSTVGFHGEGAAATKGGSAIESSPSGARGAAAEADEIVSILAFHERGLGYLVHLFQLGY
jgi:hypothetical protein